MTIIRNQWEARVLLSKNIGSKIFPKGGPNSITVDGHCMGIVARTWTGRAAGYATALDGARAVIKKGKMRKGTPPRGSIFWWSTGSSGQPGHVVTVDINGYCYSNINDKLERVPLSYFSKFLELGWCEAKDVPGWA